MNSKHMFFLMIGICILLSAGVIGVLITGDRLLKKQSGRLVELKLEDKLLDEQQAALVQATQDIERYEELEQVANLVVPKDKDQARAVREIINLALESGITIKTVSFPSSSLGTKSNAQSGSGGEQKPAASTSSITQAKPVEGVSGVYSIEMTVAPDQTTHTTYYELIDFLKKLENNRRTAQVTSVKINPVKSEGDGSNITFTLTINIFVKP